MAITQKLVGDLRPGDVMIGEAPDCRRAVFALAASGNPAELRVLSVLLGVVPADVRCDVMFVSRPQTVECAETLTLAQQHADELQEMVCRMANGIRANCLPHTIEAEARALLDKIAPPEPPTLAEALAALCALEEGARAVQAGEWDKDSMTQERYKARDVLDRARRAGLL